MAKVRIIKTTTNNYGIFEAGRVYELPPNMLARFTKETYEEIETGTESEVETKNDKDTIDKSGEENQRVRGLSPGGKRGKRDK